MLIFNCFLFSLARKTASCISAENGGPLINITPITFSSTPDGSCRTFGTYSLLVTLTMTSRPAQSDYDGQSLAIVEKDVQQISTLVQKARRKSQSYEGEAGSAGGPQTAQPKTIDDREVADATKNLCRLNGKKLVERLKRPSVPQPIKKAVWAVLDKTAFEEMIGDIEKLLTSLEDAVPGAKVTLQQLAKEEMKHLSIDLGNLIQGVLSKLSDAVDRQFRDALDTEKAEADLRRQGVQQTNHFSGTNNGEASIHTWSLALGLRFSDLFHVDQKGTKAGLQLAHYSCISMFALHVPSFEHQSSLLHYLNYPLPNMFFSSRIQSERGSRRNMSEPRLTQTNHFGLNERGAQIGHLENALFNFSMRKDPTGSESDSDVEAKNHLRLATQWRYTLDQRKSRLRQINVDQPSLVRSRKTGSGDS
ncbi:hypothetical protein KC329_g37 [Hortaea werneckii]|nr:hypothetical protein KC329_g37 [Hortaea werneckii]